MKSFALLGLATGAGAGQHKNNSNQTSDNNLLSQSSTMDIPPNLSKSGDFASSRRPKNSGTAVHDQTIVDTCRGENYNEEATLYLSTTGHLADVEDNLTSSSTSTQNLVTLSYDIRPTSSYAQENQNHGGVPCLTITDPDHIEKSNLNRQFLFHFNHVGQSKTKVAKESVLQMNPAMNIKALEHRSNIDCSQSRVTSVDMGQHGYSRCMDLDNNVKIISYRPPQAERSSANKVLIQSNSISSNIQQKAQVSLENENSVFPDKVINRLTRTSSDCPGLLFAALDCVKARRYVDQRCVNNHVAMFESGTLGPKGHVQVVIPRLTESYGSQNDGALEQNDEIPYCTLKSFPSLPVHCIEWAKEKFIGIFTLKPQQMRNLVKKFDSSNLNCFHGQMTKSLYRYIISRPKTFKDAVLIARDKFQKYFYDKAKQLLHSFPPDAKLEDGSLFWTLPKRLPKPLVFSLDDNTHVDFIISFAQITCRQFKINADMKLLHSSFDKKRSVIADILHDYRPKDFAPSSEKLIVTAEDTSKSEADSLRSSITDGKEHFDEDVHKYLLCNQNILTNCQNCEIVNFDKDDETSGALEFITAATNLRSSMYQMESTAKHEVKRIAGRITPAIATTTAAVSALVVIEFCKYMAHLAATSSPTVVPPSHESHAVSKQPSTEKADNKTLLRRLRNTFMNLALPMILMAEPGRCETTTLPNGTQFSMWDMWTVKKFTSTSLRDTSLADFIDYLRSTYADYPVVIITKGLLLIYTHYSMHEPLLKQTMGILLNPSEQEEFVDLLIEMEIPAQRGQESPSNLRIPTVRVYFDAPLTN